MTTINDIRELLERPDPYTVAPVKTAYQYGDGPEYGYWYAYQDDAEFPGPPAGSPEEAIYRFAEEASEAIECEVLNELLALYRIGA